MVAVVEAVGTGKEEGFLVRMFPLPQSYMIYGEEATVHFWHKTQEQACQAAVAAYSSAGICYPNNNWLPTSYKSNMASGFP